MRLLRWLFSPPALYLDPKRLNVEVQAERRAELERDFEYRAKVKRRMLLGLTSQELPPLFRKEERPLPSTLTFPSSARNGSNVSA